MHSPEKYLKKFTDLFDISPIESGGMAKMLVYVLWAINALLFIGKDIDFTPEFIGNAQHSTQSIQCTALKKVSSTDLYVEHFTSVNETQFVVISSYDCALPKHDVITLQRDRSPPWLLFS